MLLASLTMFVSENFLSYDTVVEHSIQSSSSAAIVMISQCSVPHPLAPWKETTVIVIANGLNVCQLAIKF